MTIARTERRALCDLMDELGPDAATLCEGWLAQDLAAHLVLRERRPDAAAGIVVGSLAGHTAKVQGQLASRPFPALVDLVRQGPPSWSPMRLEALDRLTNTTEMVIHHEDVRRAQPGWTPRPPEPQRDDAVWERLRGMGKMMVRKSPVGVSMARPGSDPVVLKAGPPGITLVGEPIELTMRLSGRRDVAKVEVQGAPDDVAAFEGTSLGI